MAEIRPYWNPNAKGVRLFYTLPSEPVITQEYADIFLKSKLNVSDYPLIQDGIFASTDDSERTTNRFYINRNATAIYDYVYDKVSLPVAPVNSVSGVTAVNPYDGEETTLTTADYDVIGGEEKYLMINGYAGYRIEIAFNAGYSDDAGSLPSWIRDAVSSRLRYKYAQQPMEMAMHERRYNDAESRHKFYVMP